MRPADARILLRGAERNGVTETDPVKLRDAGRRNALLYGGPAVRAMVARRIAEETE
jgi:hypothetical protein